MTRGVRQIDSTDPAQTASHFAAIAAKGGTIVRRLPHGGYVVRMADGSYITYRPISHGTNPAVDLNIVDRSHVGSQKIHFEKE